MTGQSRVAGLAFAAMLLSAYPPNRLTAQDPWPVLDHASQTYQTIANLSADFVQVVANPMIGAPDTTRGRLYQMRPSRFAMRFTDPKGDRIVADGRYLWLYTPSTTPGQVIRSRIPEVGTTGPNLIGQFVERPRERYTARYVRSDSLGDGVADIVTLKPKTGDQPYSAASSRVNTSRWRRIVSSSPRATGPVSAATGSWRVRFSRVPSTRGRSACHASVSDSPA